MIGFLKILPPWVLLAAGAAVAVGPGAAGGWFARGVVFERIERPAIVRQANDACTILTQDAARRAGDAERARQEQAGSEAQRAYREALAQSRIETIATEQRLAQEISDYENELAAAGRSCLLTDRDIEWLRSE